MESVKIHMIHSLWPEQQGFHLERHREEDEYIFVHFLSPARLSVEGRQFSAREGSCILYNRFSDRTIDAPDVPLLHNWFHAGGNFPALMEKYQLQFNTLYEPGCDAELTGIMQATERECMRHKPFTDEICALKIEELLARIARGAMLGAEVDLPAERQQELYALRAELQQRFAGIESVSSLAGLVHMSPARFFAAYRQMFGISPGQDLQRIRLEHAKQLLMLGSSVSETAELVGYHNPYHFIRIFRQTVGVTPGKYRNL